MLIFALSTSHTVSTEVAVKNDSSQNLKLKIIRQDEDNYGYYSEEFTLVKYQTMRLRTIYTRNKRPTPDEYITNIMIYNENGEVLKEYNKINEENLGYLFDFIEKHSDKNHRDFYFIITDETLK